MVYNILNNIIVLFSNTGKRLMAKCRLLYQENEELGRMISSGRLAKLEGDLALQRNFSEEMKKSQSGNSLFHVKTLKSKFTRVDMKVWNSLCMYLNVYDRILISFCGILFNY